MNGSPPGSAGDGRTLPGTGNIQWPCGRLVNGTIVSGFMDLLLNIPDGYIIIDHKSFSGNLEEAKEKAASFAGQLGNYAEAVESATGEKVLWKGIHLPVSGYVMEVR